ncbi:hypothetical protein ABK040_011555 [Willaertia magna]
MLSDLDSLLKGEEVKTLPSLEEVIQQPLVLLKLIRKSEYKNTSITSQLIKLRLIEEEYQRKYSDKEISLKEIYQWPVILYYIACLQFGLTNQCPIDVIELSITKIIEWNQTSIERNELLSCLYCLLIIQESKQQSNNNSIIDNKDFHLKHLSELQKLIQLKTIQECYVASEIYRFLYESINEATFAERSIRYSRHAAMLYPDNFIKSFIDHQFDYLKLNIKSKNFDLLIPLMDDMLMFNENYIHEKFIKFMRALQIVNTIPGSCNYNSNHSTNNNFFTNSIFNDFSENYSPRSNNNNSSYHNLLNGLNSPLTVRTNNNNNSLTHGFGSFSSSCVNSNVGSPVAINSSSSNLLNLLIDKKSDDWLDWIEREIQLECSRETLLDFGTILQNFSNVTTIHYIRKITRQFIYHYSDNISFCSYFLFYLLELSSKNNVKLGELENCFNFHILLNYHIILQSDRPFTVNYQTKKLCTFYEKYHIDSFIYLTTLLQVFESYKLKCYPNECISSILDRGIAVLKLFIERDDSKDYKGIYFSYLARLFEFRSEYVTNQAEKEDYLNQAKKFDTFAVELIEKEKFNM